MKAPICWSLLLAATSCTAAHAGEILFQGNLANDASVVNLTFAVSIPSLVTLTTLSYAGGTTVGGSVIPRGGFDPILVLFSGSGPTATYLAENDDGDPNVPADPLTGNTADSYIQQMLDPGTYTATIVQYDNFFNGGLGDPYSNGFRESSPTFTSRYNCSNGQFCEADGDNRTSAYALDVFIDDGTTPVAVSPEPSSLLLLGTGIAGMAGLIRRRLFS